MPDLFLRAPDAATMRAAAHAVYYALTGNLVASTDPIPSQGRSATGTEWAFDNIGLVYEASATETTTDPMTGATVPLMVPRTGWHTNLRWNGGDAVPSPPAGIEIIWSSALRDGDGNPVPRPSWWPRVFA